MLVNGIDNDWKVTVHKSNPVYPFIVVDNWYNPGEEKAVWKELDFLWSSPRENIDRDENTIVARDGRTGEARGRSYRWYINQFYTDQNLSPILNTQYKQRSKEFHSLLYDFAPYNRSFQSTNADSSLVSYYENKDYYKPHHDTFSFTCLIWMVREPRKFTGGDFILNEPDIEIKLKNNRMVLFPCSYLHEVTPINFTEKVPEEMGWGRFTLTHFYYAVPRGNNEWDKEVNENK